MKNRQFILGLLLYVWVVATGIALNISIKNCDYLFSIIHLISILYCSYKGYKLIKKTI